MVIKEQSEYLTFIYLAHLWTEQLGQQVRYMYTSILAFSSRYLNAWCFLMVFIGHMHRAAINKHDHLCHL